MRVHFTNLGCKLNQAEVERLARDFAAAGHEVVGSLAEADLHVVNSCTVTGTAARGSRQAAGRGRGRVRTVLTGCWATERPEEAARLAGVDLVVPNAEKDHLLARVHQAFPEVGCAVRTAAEPVPCSPPLSGHTRALVKVEDGCNMRCAFCIIPFTRGAQRSRPLAEVVAEVDARVREGYREVVVTGVQISAWRRGADRLADLVQAILTRTAVPRLRLTSIAPWDLDDRLLGLWSDRRLCRHLHLSLQSGATATLRRMRRPYTAESYLDLLASVRAAVPGVAITTDVIAGFPGETEAEFAESLATVEAAGFAKVHVFPFSTREGTEAEAMPGQVPPEKKKERMDRLLAAAARAEQLFHRAHLGTRATVLWEKPRDGMGHGLTDNYLRVQCPAGAGLWNRFSEVELVALAADGVRGEIVGE
ncbi:MAG TPA: tRNA (N(6)-L-threonylcarbamoyladenosine(37)-C(2))-methylthiotransferase MtaB [Thermoanaerobaculia bacterium]|jgi:threonylcarbamoyladenosine tRNA methylthiotransferase MtaB|nr:tRNA (N(6)-L-threonylcarbamoyladenosine(37)-C(2))-methylthiotransferase MtaB [Thermoanaerobaculia bacterium]